MTLEQKIGQFFFPAVFINDTEENIQATERLIRDYNIGGLTFFHSRASAATNYETKKKIVLNDDSFQRLKELIIRYQNCATTPLLMSIDAEWGLAMRVEKTPQYPYAITLGALPNNQKKLVYEVGKQIGLDLKSAGIHYNLSPLADINNNPNNPVIGYRSFGQNKEKVADFALEYLKGMNDVGILGCLKHFPGHGNTNVDSHLGLPILKETLEELLANELVPFIKGIENNVDSIMIGHLAVPALNDGKETSATLSKSVIETLLRKQLGYDGLVISDALNMHSVSKLYDQKGQLEWEAFNAGNDVLCFTENVPEGIQEILKNATPERIEASFQRIWKCKEKAGILDGKLSLPDLSKSEFDFETTSKLNLKIAQNSITKIKDGNNSKTVFDANKSNTLAKISLYKNTDNPFFKGLAADLSSPEFNYETGGATVLNELEKELSTFDTLVISLFVPKAKPLNNFDIEDSVLQFLGKVFTTKKCILYVFGNPYALQVIPNLKHALGIIEMYQDFTEFQATAAIQLLENSECKGALPVEINFL
ncbi:glycoside hydrolase family 3 protein [Flavobacterium glaciei]|uniref:beta-N-acetylhexosaminidase n=1 Tax=Flavobacterium glaciei TaxID=386300 RepID=A0A562PTQ6_9FLAO|nr:glycoside hydrolase family 3 N-terminal domain-containing protein [Flavobacterium glaciei]RDI54907.1 beta-glucosidase-like glycosyl hydrolase [Flavobacterium glaciei]TWI47815.1 beta-glucosidase-like glycosyl hydrolase [Flavobacterium glaciei]